MLCRLTHWTVSKADLINNVEPVIKVDGASLNWGCGHLIAPYYSFIYSGRLTERTVSCGRRTTFYHCVTISNQCDWIIFVQKFKELKAEMKWELIIVSLKSSAVTERSLKITRIYTVELTGETLCLREIVLIVFACLVFCCDIYLC